MKIKQKGGEMSDKCFVVPFEAQEKEINHWCFDNCGKIIFALIFDAELGGLSHCYCEDCPHDEITMDEPFGESQHGLVYLRKLKPINIPVIAR